MNIDRATLLDVRAVAEIHVDAWRSAYSRILPTDYLASLSVEQREAMWTKTVESGKPELLVAKEGGIVLGWVLFGSCRDKDAPSTQAELWAIYVAPSSWFKGIGRLLWQRARELLSLQGYSACSLWVFPDNEQAIRFYHSVGFVPDNLPPKNIELGGQQLQEVRYVCNFVGSQNAKDLEPGATWEHGCPSLGSKLAQVVSVHKSPLHAFSKQPVSSVTLIAGMGVEGDAHEGATVKHRSRVARDPSQPNLRQVHLIHSELLDELAIQGFPVSHGSLGENITTRGVDLLALPQGTELRLGAEAIVVVTGLRNPCAQLDAFSPGLMKAVLDRAPDGELVRKAGVMGVVRIGGKVSPGDPIQLFLPAGPALPLTPV